MKPIFKVRERPDLDQLDFSWILGESGLTWSRNDIDTKNTTRSQVTGDMLRKRLTTKRKLNVRNCLRMTTAQIHALNVALDHDKIWVEILDPLTGGYREAEFYGSTIETSTQIYDPVSEETYWNNTTFSLIEV